MKCYKKRLGADARRAIGRAVLATGVLATSAAVVSAPAAYAQVQTFNFNIDKQPLSAALLAFGRQADLSVLAPTPLIAGKMAPEVRGQLNASEALDRLLDGTGLTYAYVEANAIKIIPKERADLAPSAPEEGGDSPERVVVTGTNIRGAPSVASPIEVYTARDIARTGSTTTEQFVGKLPQNLGTLSQYAAGATTAGLNLDAVTGIDLRGLGVGTTLTLLNGHRLALASGGRSADVSFIPLSAIDRVEVLTDGASAIYGSDAVGGVVNFILRDDFEGAETRISQGGATSGGLRQTDASQVFGARWTNGHGLVGYDFHAASALQTSDRSYAVTAGPGNLTPVDTRHNIFATGSQDFGDRLTFNFDLGGTWRKVKDDYSNLASPALANQIFVRYVSKSDELFGTAGLDYRFNDKLTANVTITYSGIDTSADADAVRFNLVPPLTTSSDFDARNTGLDLSAKLDGSLFALPAGDVRFSVGGGVLKETYRGVSPASGVQSAGTLARQSRYAFGEVLVPLIAPSQNIPFARRLSLDLAARYTDHDDKSDPRLGQEFGDSTDPKIGLSWAPLDALTFRGSYGSSFRAPSLTQLDPTAGQHYLLSRPVGGSPAIVLGLINHAGSDLKPETANTYTVGFDYQMTTGFRFSGTYYNIDYTNRIGIAPTGGLNPFTTPNQLPDLIYRAPSADFIANALRATPLLLNTSGVNLSDPVSAASTLYSGGNVWVFDNRFRNLATSRQDGFDIAAKDDIKTSWGDLALGLNATHVLAYKQQGSSTSPVVSSLGVPGQPVDWRGRAYASLISGRFGGTLGVNYVDSYANPLAPAGQQKIDSWTTVDLILTYDLRRGASKGSRFNLSIQNLLDKNPPHLDPVSGSNIVYPVGFDPANANPLGRFLVLGLTQTW
jgi:outer membrane receptor protein involved in Fe transport